MIDNEIKEMFYKKNKEIIMNKMKLDFSNNMDSLGATLSNITYLEFAIYRQKILEIEKGEKHFKRIENTLVSFEKHFNFNLDSLLKEKNKNCLAYLNEMDIDKDLDNYYVKLENETELLYKGISSFLTRYIDKEVLSKWLLEEWYLRNDKKVNFFLNEKLGEDILEKIHSQLKERDTIIFNNAKESYEKYLALNDNFK